MEYLSREEYFQRTKELRGGHWTENSLLPRWDYHEKTIKLVKSLKLKEARSVLEMGTMGVQIVHGSDTIDYAERWNFRNKKPTIMHDARLLPWPIGNKQYELFVALRVFQHLAPFQKDCIQESMRIAKRVILVLPRRYNNRVLPDSRGITYEELLEYNNGLHPNLCLKTKNGDLYFWDTERPSSLDLRELLYKIDITNTNNRIMSKLKLQTKKLLKELKPYSLFAVIS